MQRLRTRLRASASRGAPAALSLDFLSASGALDPRITFSRGSNATLTDSTGRITYAPNNLLLSSDDFGSANWIKTEATITANSAVAPNGTTTMDTLIPSTVSAGHFVYRDISATGVVASIYAKAAGYSWLRINLAGVGSVWFNVSTGVVGTVAAGLSGSITAVGNGIYRCSAYTSGSITRVSYAIEPADNVNAPWSGNGTSGILIWGAQLEQVTYQTTPGTYNSTSPKNLLGFTQEFDNAAWTKTNATVTANAVYAPDGTLTADKLVETTAASVHQTSQIYSGGLVGGIYTFSAYLAKGERTKAFFSVTDNATGDGRVIVDLDAGTIGTPTVSGNWSDVSATIQAVSGNFYRVSLTLKKAAGGNSNVVPIIGLYTTTNNYTGDGTSGIYVWGAQLSDSASLDPYVYNPAAAAASTAYYGPRFDYDPVTLAAKGLLIEEARTNLLTYASDFSNPVWQKTNITVTSAATTSPDGTANAQKVAATAAASTNLTTTATAVAATSATFSVYVKQGTGPTTANVFGLRNATAGTNLVFITLNFTTGAVAYSVGTTGATATNVGNGWWRVQLSAVSGITSGDTLLGYVGWSGGTAAAGDFIYAWGAQLEAASFATSYIPTVASQVTRSADVATMIGDNFRNWYNPNAGTVSVQSDTVSASVNAAAYALGSSASDIMRVFRQTDGQPVFQVVTGGAAQATIGLGTSSWPIASVPKVASAYEANNFAASVNGGAVVTDTSGTVPVVSQLAIGFAAGIGYLNGHVQSIGYYNTRQPNATLQTLTNPSTTPSLALNFISDTYTVGA